MDAVLALLVGALPVAKIILEILGSLVIIATVVVKLTPSQGDDAFLEKVKVIPVLGDVLRAIEKFSVISRKE